MADINLTAAQVAAIILSVGDRTNLNTTDKTTLVAAINEVLSDSGDLSSLNTTEKSNLVAAINEVFGDIGSLGSLNTAAKNNLVAAVNEIVAEIGSLSGLNTTAKNNIVAAINEVFGNVGQLSTLTTGNKDSAVAAINELAAETDNCKGGVNALAAELSQVESAVVDVQETDTPITLTYSYGYYTYTVGSTATFVSDPARQCAVVSASAGDKFKLSTRIGSYLVAGIIYTDENDVVIANDLVGDGYGVHDYTDYVTTAPAGTAKLIVGSADYRDQYKPTLKSVTTTISAKAYTKAESDARYAPIGADTAVKRYGVKWQLNNPNDLGARCFDAVGLTAQIGIGATDGISDFDTIYPWSEMKRCNISTNANGAKIVTFEGESGFALDGSNGDVFVRIPKFCYERYSDNGYEYIVITDSGRAVHPAFIENGNTLDEIFVGAFEGSITGSKLHSVDGVIPTSNLTGADFLDAAEANGTGYTLYDMRTISAVWMLMAVEYGCRNSNRIIGYGAADYLQPIATYSSLGNATSTNSITISKLSAGPLYNMPIGSNITICNGGQETILTQAKLLSITSDSTTTTITFDGAPVDITTSCFVGSAALSTNWCENAPSGALTWHTGRAGWITGAGATVQNPMRYRWVENVVGNLWHYVPDVRFNNGQMYQCRNMENYGLGSSISSSYTPVGAVYPAQTSNGVKSDGVNENYWMSELSDNYFAKGVLFGAGYDMAQTSTVGFGGYYYLNTSGVRNIVNGGGFDHLYRCNILTHRAWIAYQTIWFLIGARLLYKDVF